MDEQLRLTNWIGVCVQVDKWEDLPLALATVETATFALEAIPRAEERHLVLIEVGGKPVLDIRLVDARAAAAHRASHADARSGR